MRALRLAVYDRTCCGARLRPGLSHAWAAGGLLYGALGRLDAWHGAASWAEALDWIAAHEAEAPIREIQYWGHGRWGRVLLAGEPLDAAALAPGHPHHDRLVRIRGRLRPDGEALWWFRTCETFGREAGRAFARAWSRFFGCRAAGHTYVIGVLQSGLHCLRPGDEPGWPAEEGLPPGEPDPRVALRSRPGAPNTITCLHGAIPAGM